MSALNGAQRRSVDALMLELGATAYTAERDDPHDAHVFVVLYAGTTEVAELIVEGDGEVQRDDDDAAPLPAVHGERYRRADGSCGCDLCRFGATSNLAAALRHDLDLGPAR